MSEKLAPYSVLMSVYAKEAPDNLRQSLDSVLSQTLPPDEIILVKDGPLTAELDSVIDEAAACHEGLFKIVPLEKNTGLGNALNVGLAECANEYVARMDSDDVAYPNRMEKQVGYLAEHPEVDILSAAIEEFDGDITNVTSRRVVPLENDAIWRFAKTRCPFNHNCVMYKKSAVQAVYGYRTDLTRVEDHDLWMRMHTNGAIGANLAEPLLWARAGENMHVKRHGKENAAALHVFYRELYQLGEISLPRYVYNIVCACGLQLMPTGLHKFCYKLIRLKKTPYGAKKEKKAGNEKPVTGGTLAALSEEEIKSAQSEILQIYRDVKKLCDENGLTLILSGGSCLGAVRHRGFIPWDDDMDCVMPRGDYEKLKLVFDSALGDKYAMQVPNCPGHVCSNLFMKIVSRKQCGYLQAEQAADPGLKGFWLDIVPMEYAPENAFKRTVKGIGCDLLAYAAVSRYLFRFRNPIYRDYMKRSLKSRIEYAFRNVLGFLLAFRPYEKWYDLFDRVSRGKEETKLITFPAGKKHYLGETLPVDTFLPPGEGEFEGESVSLPAQAHTYLRHFYGADYMRLPPEEERKAHPVVKMAALKTAQQ